MTIADRGAATACRTSAGRQCATCAASKLAHTVLEPGKPRPTPSRLAHRERRCGKGTDPREVVIGVSPAFGNELTQTTAGHDLIDVVLALTDGIREGRRRTEARAHTPHRRYIVPWADGGAVIGFGLFGRHPGQRYGGDPPRADRLPHMNIELFSNAPVTTLEHTGQWDPTRALRQRRGAGADNSGE